MIPIFCDNTSDNCIAKNISQYSCFKHIDVRHQFIRDHIQKCDFFDIQFIDIENQCQNIFKKSHNFYKFSTCMSHLGIIKHCD